jgi:hypothetical protein
MTGDVPNFGDALTAIPLAVAFFPRSGRAERCARDASHFVVWRASGGARRAFVTGQRCRVVIETEGADFCPHHARQADEYGAELVRSGAVPKKPAPALRIGQSPRLAIGSATSAEWRSGQVGSVRESL